MPRHLAKNAPHSIQGRPSFHATGRKAIRDLYLDRQGEKLLVPGDHLLMSIGMKRSLESLFVKTFGLPVASSFLYEMGKEVGAHSARLLREAGFTVMSPKNLPKAGQELATLWGWKTLQTMELDFHNKLFRSRLTGSAYVRNSRGKTPVCHFGRGSAAGTFSIVFGKSCESIEIACEGRRDDYCELMVGTPRRIARQAENFLPRDK